MFPDQAYVTQSVAHSALPCFSIDTLHTPCSVISHTSHSLLHTLLCHAPASILYITYTVFADQLYVTQSIAHCSVSIRHRYFALIYTVFADQPYVTQSVAHCSVTICDYTYCLEWLAERYPRPRTSVFICHFILGSISLQHCLSLLSTQIATSMCVCMYRYSLRRATQLAEYGHSQKLLSKEKAEDNFVCRWWQVIGWIPVADIFDLMTSVGGKILCPAELFTRSLFDVSKDCVLFKVWLRFLMYHV